jgi:hypothetical protein
METKEATKVGCSACKTNKGVKQTQNFLFWFGGIMFAFAIYGIISFIYDIINFF